MQVSTSSAPGSAINPRSYRFYNLGPDGVDNRGTGDDVLFPITAVNYNSTTNQATLSIDPASLADPTRAAGSIYKVLVLGASQTNGLRDLAGNLLDGGQDVFAAVNVARQPQLDLPQSLVSQEGSTVSFNASLAHYTFGQTYSATIQWGDGTSSKVNGNDALPIELFTSSHVYAANGGYTVTVTVNGYQQRSRRHAVHHPASTKRSTCHRNVTQTHTGIEGTSVAFPIHRHRSWHPRRLDRHHSLG